MPNTSAGANDAGCQLGVVARFQHDGKRQEAHQRYHGADNAGSRCKQRAGDQGRDRERAGYPTRGHLHAEKKPIQDVRAFYHVAHEQEQRHGG